eukprot:CAMPEP_0201622798 /NCGR_PEP_ID=MMETSP0492-20130828/47586_1 /ASSEMBLY_ACC=CAM_ASM_000837 /TAXON_ID=420259 /ORGANISM="Thalassiosira gravida, Strain GMp14c1" /LENGTH=245 /DNA_ID=CAMNT_0048092391 /DNA_START=208 /DNA_END=945 /DNA_ORIENTATION=+
MDDETPSWLEQGASSTPAAAAAAPEPPAETPAAPPAFALSEDVVTPTDKTENKTAPTSSTDNVAGSIFAGSTVNNTENAAAVNAADEAELPRIILLMRVTNMAAATALIICSVFQIIPTGTLISVWIMSIYAMCGGILVCCLETQLKFVRTIIAMNFGFLFNSVYRFLFYCLMASVTWSYGGVWGPIAAISLGTVAVFNTYVLCRYPAYRKMREKIAGEEDRRIQGKINAQVSKQAAAQMGWGQN